MRNHEEQRGGGGKVGGEQGSFEGRGGEVVNKGPLSGRGE